MNKLKKSVGTFLLVGALLVPLFGCSGNAPDAPQGGTNTDDVYTTPKATQADPLAQMQSATLQYPSSNDEWEYNVYDCYIELTKYLGPEVTSLTIPAEIDGLPVWSLNAGLKNTSHSTFPGDALQSVTFPDCLLEIGDYTFSHCDLTSVSLPDGIRKIGDWAFWGDYSEVTIPASVQEIGEGAFCSRCHYTVTVLNSDVDLGYRCFEYADTVIGYAGSTAAQYCVDHADTVYECTFQVME